MLSGLALAADSSGVRISAPALGWLLSPDGSQLIQMTGVAESPRTGATIALESPARAAWAAPDASAILLKLDTGLALLHPGGQLEPVPGVPPSVHSAIWDRSSAGFAVCWQAVCQAFDPSGAIRSRWEVASAARPLAFSAELGLVTLSPDGADWHQAGRSIRLDSLPAAAAFRPGTGELWFIDAAGTLSQQDSQGLRRALPDLVPSAIGLVAALDGKSIFAVNAEGAAATANLDTLQADRFSVEDSVEGAWPAPGAFAIRLHESAKRPISIWNGETGLTGRAPAFSPESEVRQ